MEFLARLVLFRNISNEANNDDDANEVNEADEANQVDETDEAGTLQGQTAITADEAKAAAEAAHPGAKAVAVELEREGGEVIYEVELDNGLEVLVNPANGDVLGAERDEAD